MLKYLHAYTDNRDSGACVRGVGWHVSVSAKMCLRMYSKPILQVPQLLGHLSLVLVKLADRLQYARVH